MYDVSMNAEPTKVAVKNEIRELMYIDWQAERRTDGLSRFQAIASSPSIWLSGTSGCSTEEASISLAQTSLEGR